MSYLVPQDIVRLAYDPFSTACWRYIPLLAVVKGGKGVGS